MFGVEAKAVMKNVGAHGDLISNNNLNCKMDLLTLVKVRKGNFWKIPKYTTMTVSLPELMDGDEEFCPDYVEEELVKDFTTSMETSGSGSVAGGDGVLGEAKLSANVDTVDGLALPVSMMKKKADIKKIRNKFSGRKIKRNNVDMLGLKDSDKLTFVHQTVYNTGPVKLIRKSTSDGLLSGSCQKMINLLVKGSKKEETSFTVPEKSTFAYGLTEIVLKDDELNIKCEPWTHKTGFDLLLCSDSTNTATLQDVKEGVEMKEGLLQPLARLPESTRHELLKKLCEVLKNRDDLSELEETLEQVSRGTYERPQNQAVSSFLDVLPVSDVSSDVKDAVYILISSLDALPDEAPPLLTSCSKETLRVLQQLVDALKKDGQAKLPESLPPSLQEEGELRWAAELLCSTNDSLRELSDNWGRPECPPQTLMEVLCLIVQGLVALQ